MSTERKYQIGEAAKMAGVSQSTLRRWERDGIITPERTPKGTRRYTADQLEALVTADKPEKTAS